MRRSLICVARLSCTLVIKELSVFSTSSTVNSMAVTLMTFQNTSHRDELQSQVMSCLSSGMINPRSAKMLSRGSASSNLSPRPSRISKAIAAQPKTLVSLLTSSSSAPTNPTAQVGRSGLLIFGRAIPDMNSQNVWSISSSRNSCPHRNKRFFDTINSCNIHMCCHQALLKNDWMARGECLTSGTMTLRISRNNLSLPSAEGPIQATIQAALEKTSRMLATCADFSTASC